MSKSKKTPVKHFEHIKDELNNDLEKAVSLIGFVKNDISTGGKYIEASIEDLRIAKHWIEGVEIKMSRTLRKSKQL